MVNFFLSLDAANQELAAAVQNLNGRNHTDIFQMCPVYNPEDVRENLPMISNADPAAVEEKVFLGVNIDNEADPSKSAYMCNHFFFFPSNFIRAT